MVINSDILTMLEIEAVYVVSNNKIYFCVPIEINGFEWIVAGDSGEIPKDGLLKVKFKGVFLYFKAHFVGSKSDGVYSYSYNVIISSDEIVNDKIKKCFFGVLKETEEKQILWNKRKEERYEIGMDERLVKLIEFRFIQQEIIDDGKRIPCVVDNLSYSGAKITTFSGNYYKEKEICVFLTFTNPIEQIPILCTIKNCIMKLIDSKTIVSILSLKFNESPYLYKKRLTNFIEKLKGGCK